MLSAANTEVALRETATASAADFIKLFIQELRGVISGSRDCAAALLRFYEKSMAGAFLPPFAGANWHFAVIAS
jgi:hypothetical protein